MGEKKHRAAPSLTDEQRARQRGLEVMAREAVATAAFKGIELPFREIAKHHAGLWWARYPAAGMDGVGEDGPYRNDAEDG